MMKDFTEVDWKKKVTDVKGVVYGRQPFPWPMAERDMLFSITGVRDHKNQAVVSVSQSIDAG